MKKDQDKTKEQMMNELMELRRRTAELETAETECKQAEEALRECEEKHRRLFELSPIGVITLDMKGQGYLITS